MGMFTSGDEDSDYSVTQRAVSFPISTLMSAYGSAGFFLSSLLYYGVVDLSLVIPQSYQFGFTGSLVLMFASLFMAVWTLDSMPVTFFGPMEWGVLALQVVFLLAPIVSESFFSSLPVMGPLFGVGAGMMFWFVCVRGAWDNIFGGD